MLFERAFQRTPQGKGERLVSFVSPLPGGSECPTLHFTFYLLMVKLQFFTLFHVAYSGFIIGLLG